MGIIEHGCGRENYTHKTKPSALSFLETATGSIIFVVYERKRCFNWLVYSTINLSGPVKISQVIRISMGF